ncbi:conserved hypothetical protein [Culex quinquefasciatus]|uniref:Uncharacterized protein n=1 Tax=Culex quinquefasciatus TaxID=7176 RepID=B0WS14_CULQU|nr:conserved hypothetical protein [Culex quinquefasciatus]|eukprot:XP_001851498.1 conserved hypothetical protein [Culex quinquefasciatus]
MAVLIEVARSRCKSMTLRRKCCQFPVIYGRGRCIQARAPSGSSLSEVIGPRGWFMSAPVGGRPNIMPPAPRGTDDGYSFRPHSSSSVGQGDAELKPGTVSSERSFSPLSYTVTTIVTAC